MKPDAAIGVLERTPPTLRALLGGLSDDLTSAGGHEEEGGPFDVVGHLIFGEETDWIPRARIILEHGDSRPFVPFDRFAQFEKFKGRSLDDLLSKFERARDENLQTLREMKISTDQWGLRGMHPELGPVTLGQLLATWVVHDLNHIGQIAEWMAERDDAAGGAGGGG